MLSLSLFTKHFQVLKLQLNIMFVLHGASQAVAPCMHSPICYTWLSDRENIYSKDPQKTLQRNISLEN
jgi:hypothetical protein